MLRNFLKTTVRNLAKNKSYSIINVAGLSLGIVCALSIFLIIKFEYSFDTYHPNAQSIYRIVTQVDRYGEIDYDPGVAYPLPRALRTDFPEIELLTIVDSNLGVPVIAIEHNGDIARYRESDREVTFVNPDYFALFRYDWLLGNPQEALISPGSVVISKDLAQKYFGDINPLGRTLRYNNSFDLQVTGVVGEPRANSDFPFRLLIAYDHEQRGNDNWGSVATTVQCYVRLPEQVGHNQIEGRLHDFVAKHRSEEIAQQITLSLQPLSEVHFDTRFENFRWRTVSEESLLTLGLIGLFLIITACINFINLNTALAVKRSKEVGVRKVMGGTRRHLAVLFLGETAMVTLIAILISIPVIELIVVNLKSFLGYNLDLDLFGDPAIAILLAALSVSVTMVAGFYPALYLSGFSPIDAMRTKIHHSYGEGLSLRKGLVVLQFAISQVLIVSTLVMSWQIRFVQNADMGFNKEALVEVSLPINETAKLVRLKNDLLQQTSIKSVSFSNTGSASGNTWGGGYEFTDGDEIKKGEAQVKFADQDFMDTYEMDLLAGEGLGASDTLAKFLVNEAFVRRVGHSQNHQEVIGKFVKVWGREAPIVGVVGDFNTTSLHTDIAPVIVLMQNRFWKAGIRIDLQDLKGALSAIGNAWSSAYPEYVFDYTFLDETIEKFYEEEQKTARLINLFTTIAILIGCLGLFGLVSYMATQRTKEIGIRKVLGASFTSILSLFSREFAVLIVLAFMLAAPCAYLFMNSWLTEFAYRINLGAGTFLLALSASCMIAFVTVGYKSIQAAIANPADSLRSE
jgi:ABC-type antimicrobial peptide transport system permease subunit